METGSKTIIMKELAKEAENASRKSLVQKQKKKSKVIGIFAITLNEIRKNIRKYRKVRSKRKCEYSEILTAK